MTLYQGEDPEGAITYLESQEYRILLTNLKNSPDGQFTRPLFSVMNDGGGNCTDDACFCYPYPVTALASITEEDALQQWDNGNYSIMLPHEISEKYWRQHDERRMEFVEKVRG